MLMAVFLCFWQEAVPAEPTLSVRLDAPRLPLRSRLQNGQTAAALPASKRELQEAMAALDAAGLLQPAAIDTNPPPRCQGYGSLQSIALTNWDSGLGTWSVGSYGKVNPATFSTPDWHVVNTLPTGRTGNAAFVDDLNAGNCTNDIESGVLTLLSPAVTIPAGTGVPRISFFHWFGTELGWDGGQLMYALNGSSSYNLLPASAIEINPYNSTLYYQNDFKDNPLSPPGNQPAYTGPNLAANGTWADVRVNLLGLAAAGDSVRLRFDFGVDGCGGSNKGWYVDDVEFYRCSAELPPSNCGNLVLDAGEQCDDGNNFIGDGCSNTCQIEAGWQCTAPKPPGTIGDPGFEAGTPNPSWTEASVQFGTPICSDADCGPGTGTGAASGEWWAWFGGTEVGQPTDEEASLSQNVTIPATATQLTFELEISACDSAADYLEVLLDGNQVYLINGSSPLCGQLGYQTQTVDITPYANGGSHSLVFHGETFANNLDVTNIFIDDVAIPGVPSQCSNQASAQLTLNKVVTNDNGGTESASAWTLSADGPTPFSGSGPTVSSGSITAGTYTLSESGPAGYTASAWVCTGGGNQSGSQITLSNGQSASCTITNNDIAPSLTLNKVLVKDNGGTAAESNWTLNAAGPTPLSGPGAAGAADVVSNSSFKAGAYTLSESGGPAGYTASAWSCTGTGSQNGSQITLNLGQSAVCTITNNDQAPSLTLNKIVVNDNGGTALPSSWTLTASGPTPISGPGAAGSNDVQSGPTFAAGSYTLSESAGPGGYAASAWSCTGNGSQNGNQITLGLGQSAVCAITNNDLDQTQQIFANGFESN